MDNDDLEKLRSLCDQAGKLRDAADRLCADLTKRINRSKRIVSGRRRKWNGQNRRKTPR